MERPVRDKDSNLFVPFVSYEEKSFTEFVRGLRLSVALIENRIRVNGGNRIKPVSGPRLQNFYTVVSKKHRALS